LAAIIECAEKRESPALECLLAAHSTTWKEKLERETGSPAPSTNQRVEFAYRLVVRPDSM
jgi:hypothetical protein